MILVKTNEDENGWMRLTLTKETWMSSVVKQYYPDGVFVFSADKK